MDAHALKIEDDTFDVTGSQFGVMLVPDQPLALREMVRVTKPGGRVLLIAYGSPAEFETLQFFIAALQAVVPDFEGLPDDPPPLDFQVADPEVLRQRLIDAGLKDVVVDTTHEERVEFGSGEQMWNWVLNSNPIAGMIIGDLTPGPAGDGAASARRDAPRTLRRQWPRRAHRPAQHRSRTKVAVSAAARMRKLCRLLILLGKVVGRLLSKFYEWLQRSRRRDVQVVRIRQLA